MEWHFVFSSLRKIRRYTDDENLVKFDIFKYGGNIQKVAYNSLYGIGLRCIRKASNMLVRHCPILRTRCPHTLQHTHTLARLLGMRSFNAWSLAHPLAKRSLVLFKLVSPLLNNQNLRVSTFYSSLFSLTIHPLVDGIFFPPNKSKPEYIKRRTTKNDSESSIFFFFSISPFLNSLF